MPPCFEISNSRGIVQAVHIFLHNGNEDNVLEVIASNMHNSPAFFKYDPAFDISQRSKIRAIFGKYLADRFFRCPE